MKLDEKLATLTDEANALLQKHKSGEFTEDDAKRSLELADERADVLEKMALMKSGSDAIAQFGDVAQVNETPHKDRSNLSLGEQFVASEGYKEFKSKTRGGRVPDGSTIEIRANKVRNARKDLLTSVTGNPAPVRTSDVDDLVYRPERRLLEVVTRGTTDLTWFEYRQIIAKENNSKIVPEATSPTDDAALKPVSGLTTQTAEAKAHTYADGMEVTNQELADDGIISTLINSTLTENLDIRLEDILLNGAGTADEPAGILNTTGVLQQAFVTDMPTSIRKAITKLRVTSGGVIQGVLMNPEDDEAWDLLKDSHGDYISNGPYGVGPGTAWGYERIVSQSVPVGQAIIGDFRTVHLLQKDPLEILAFNQHKDYAQRNLTYIRAELRALQLVRNPARLCVVDLVSGA